MAIISVDHEVTKANLADMAGSDLDSTAAAGAIIDAASPEENPREWSATVVRGHR